jgi:catechol 2,3-dioxygenase-like lactoylglutathione lyase family enzyme
MFEIKHIDHVALLVKDLDFSVKWYREVLGLERYYEGAWDGVPTMLGKGNTCIALFKTSSNNPNPAPDNNTIKMLHLAFKSDRENFMKARDELKEKGIDFTFQDHEIAHSLYFKDPDGHLIEITTYEI